MYSDSELDFELDLQNCNNKNPNSVPNIQKHQKRIVTNLIRKGGGGNKEKDLRGGKRRPICSHARVTSRVVIRRHSGMI